MASFQKDEKVDDYIKHCPDDAQSKLNIIRATIREVAPDAIERADYFQIPGYSYEGYDYDGMLAWFSYKKPNVRLHVRPPVIQNHKKELEEFKTTKSIVSFPDDEDLPVDLIKKLVQASINVMKN
jgi:uncharacterized protein YdhG (YjbR/CyaY superfamily)